jgi:cytoskeletal protein RodZ
MSTAIGQTLREARERLSLTVEQVAQSTHIRAHYLKSMEAGEFNALPSLTQARGFLRAYASFLNIDPEPLLADLSGIELEPKIISTSIVTKASSRINQEDAGKVKEIFTEIGQKLQTQRGLLGLSIDDVEHQTHLREHYLQALEAGDIESLPSPVQGRGMLQNYATFLGMDPEPLLLRFADGLLARLAAKQTNEPDDRMSTVRSKPSMPRTLQRLLSGDILVGGTLFLFLVIFVIWVSIRIFTMSTEQVTTPTAPSIVDVLLASPTPSNTPTLLPPTPTIPGTLQIIPTQFFATFVMTGTLVSKPQTGVQVYISVSQRAWMRVTVDGKIEFEGRVLPGSAYPFIGESQVEVLTGNGAALQIFFGGTDLGQMGEFGQVVNRIYSQQGVQNPTPTVTWTSTATRPAEPTPLATITPVSGEATAPPLP